MKQLKTVAILLFTTSLVSCTGHGGAPQAKTGKNTLLIDTNKLKADEAALLNAISNGKPDTNKLKAAGADILSTDASILSDSGISRLGDSNDPAVKAAQNALIKMRNAIGITPAALDSIKKAGAVLNKNAQAH